jgi:hypothetical protein
MGSQPNPFGSGIFLARMHGFHAAEEYDILSLKPD